MALLFAMPSVYATQTAHPQANGYTEKTNEPTASGFVIEKAALHADYLEAETIGLPMQACEYREQKPTIAIKACSVFVPESERNDFVSIINIDYTTATAYNKHTILFSKTASPQLNSGKH